MVISSTLKVLLLLPALIYAQSCVYLGKTYSHLETIPHENECAKFQCQKGLLVAVYEACPRNIDGECHFVGSQFYHRYNLYNCTTRNISNLPVYSNEPLPNPTPPGCTVNGTQYDSGKRFQLSDGCLQYQCQSGTVAVTSPAACDKTLDGKCNYVNSWAVKDDKVYKCEKKWSVGKLYPQPQQCSSCTLDNKTLDFLETRRGTRDCDTYQCQEDKLVTLTEVCPFLRSGGCYPLNQQVKGVSGIFGCVKNTDGRLELKVILPSFKQCILRSTTYDHLQTVTNTCSVRQCQNGLFILVHSACQDRQGNCRPLNTIWSEGSNLFQCTNKDLWGVGVNRLRGEEIIPVCEKPGKDIVFVIDNSGSIGAANFEKLKTFIARLTLRFFIGTNTSNAEFQFGVVSFSNVAQKDFDLNTYTENTQLYNAIMGIRYVGQATYTNLALNYIVDNNMFSKGRTSAPDIALLVTDGVSTVPSRTLYHVTQNKIGDNNVLAAAKRLRDSNVQIMALGVGTKINTAELNNITNNPSDVYNINDFDSFKKIEDRFSYSVCTAPVH